jgi:hypothetical protein
MQGCATRAAAGLAAGAGRPTSPPGIPCRLDQGKDRRLQACHAQPPRIAAVPALPARAAPPCALDMHIGRQVAFLRGLYQASVAELADRLGCTAEQVERFEAAAERIGAERLLDLARVFNVQVRFFFDGFRQVGAPARGRRDLRAEELFADARLAA